MIGTLRGAVVDLPSSGEVVVEVGGVGYRVQVTPQTAAELAAGGGVPRGDGSGVGRRGETFLYVHTHVRDDAIVLYGFRNADERRCFESLLGAHGVGPALALAVLSVLSPAELSTAVAAQDASTLCRVPGVGKKTAARLLLELEARLVVPELVDGGQPATPIKGPSLRDDAMAALVELGYGTDEVEPALEAAPDATSVEALVRGALRALARSR
ncbi:MAG: Holliday junction branch migration protein RuvA [Acidimicrobiales bacterium]